MPHSSPDEDEEQAKHGLKGELKANELSQKVTEYFNDEDKRNAASQTYPTEKLHMIALTHACVSSTDPTQAIACMSWSTSLHSLRRFSAAGCPCRVSLWRGKTLSTDIMNEVVLHQGLYYNLPYCEHGSRHHSEPTMA